MMKMCAQRHHFPGMPGPTYPSNISAEQSIEEQLEFLLARRYANAVSYPYSAINPQVTAGMPSMSWHPNYSMAMLQAARASPSWQQPMHAVDQRMAHLGQSSLVASPKPGMGVATADNRVDGINEEVPPMKKKRVKENWDALFQRLVQYKMAHGDCIVPQRYKEEPKLGKWVMHQRNLKKTGRLHPDREQRLDDIGFTWSLLNSNDRPSWEDMLATLKAYKAERGNCLVPFRYRKNPRLGRWVRKQRDRKDSLPADKKAQLDDMGFVWNVFSQDEC
mmetsp:Transcript_4133/g.5951  ORF Transcript_4133/g.5951 Transcript_4133/m.5951 type:complete len:276 (-) Transcript_4133:306-1133(-)